MIQLPKRLEKIKPYKPGKPSSDLFGGTQVEKQVILCSNENNLGPSPMALRAISDGLSNLHMYPDPTGSDLRFRLGQHWEIDPENIILCNGSDGLLYSLFKAFFEDEEELLTSEGSFVSLDAMAQMNGVPLRKVPLTPTYEFDLNAIRRAISTRTKAIYLCNPNNPTGTMIPRDRLMNFIASIPENILIIVDEAYFEFAKTISAEYPDSTVIQKPNVLTLRTFSKAYGLAGLRLGYGIGSPQLIEALLKVKLTFNPNSLAQLAGVSALNDRIHLQKTVQNNKIGLGHFYEVFEKLHLSYIPSYANFVMIDFGTVRIATQIAEGLKRRGILVRQLAAFGLPHCIRVSIGTPVDNQHFIDELLRIIPKMRHQRA